MPRKSAAANLAIIPGSPPQRLRAPSELNAAERKGSQGPQWVKSAVFGLGRLGPVFTDKPTIFRIRATSHQGQIRSS
jgi:hypothetical protein